MIANTRHISFKLLPVNQALVTLPLSYFAAPCCAISSQMLGPTGLKKDKERAESGLGTVLLTYVFTQYY